MAFHRKLRMGSGFPGKKSETDTPSRRIRVMGTESCVSTHVLGVANTPRDFVGKRSDEGVLLLVLDMLELKESETLLDIEWFLCPVLVISIAETSSWRKIIIIIAGRGIQTPLYEAFKN
jgi:hypothetical protein